MKNRNRKIIQTTINFPCEKIQNACTRHLIEKNSRLMFLDQKENFANNINERPGTDHVTSGPMRGLEKLHSDTQTQAQTHTDRQTDMAILWLNWHSGADSVKFPHTGGALTLSTCANNSIV